MAINATTKCGDVVFKDGHRVPISGYKIKDDGTILVRTNEGGHVFFGYLKRGEGDYYKVFFDLKVKKEEDIDHFEFHEMEWTKGE